MRILSLGIERFGTLAGVELAVAAPSGATESAPASSPALVEKPPPARRAAGTRTAKKSASKKASARGPALFPDLGVGFTLIHGPNEAGKTTLLRAIRYLLLGEDKTSAGKKAPALAGGAPPDLRATIELHSGSCVELQRRRGKPDFVGRMQGGSGEFDAEWFAGAIGHPDASLFRNVFAFSLDELARGREVLERGLLDGLLFGSGLGGSIQPSAILAELEDAQSRLFKERGQQQPILLKLARIEELKGLLRGSTTSSDELERLDAALEQKQRDVDAARAALGAVAAEHERLVALKNALEPFAAWQAAKRELETLGPVPELPPHARVELEKARAVGSRLRDEDARDEALVPELEAALAGATFDPRWLEAESDIEALDRAAATYAQDEARRPEAARELAALEARVERRLGELAPFMTLTELRRFTVAKEVRARLAGALEQKERTEKEARQQAAVLAAAKHERDTLLGERASLVASMPPGGAGDVGRIATWLEGATEHLALRERLLSLDTEIQRAERSEAVLRSALDPALPAGDPATVPVPRSEELDAFDRYLGEHDETLRNLRGEMTRLQREMAIVQGELAELRADIDVPTEGDLGASRERRNHGWVLLQRAMKGDRDFGAEVDFAGELPLEQAFENAMYDADVLVDRMRFRADVVQQRAQRERRAIRLEAEMEHLAESHAAASHARDVAIGQWNALWESARIVPKNPAAMRAWLGDRARWIDASEKLRHVVGERAALAARIQTFEASGRAVLGGGGDLVQLRAEAERRVARERERAENERRVDSALARAADTIARADERVRALEEERAAADRAAVDAWNAIPLVERIGEAPDVATLDALAALSETLVSDEAAIQARAAKIATAMRAFEERLDTVLARVGRARSAAIVAAEVADLKKQLTRAQAAARRAEDARERLKRLARDRASRAVDRKAAETTLAELRARAGVTDDVALERATERAERAATLVRTIDEAARAMARGRGPFSLEALEAACAAASADTIEAELAALASRREAASRALETALKEHATLTHQRDALDGSAKAADLLGDVAAERAALRADVEEYAVLALAKAVLERGIETFERAHQPALVEKASELFAEMTTGRYARVRTTANKELFVETAAGTLRSPEELSTGTNEQLFFALRLAYVALYGENAEPLPVVLDDVLVNFDRGRAAATLAALGNFAKTTQVLFFTCHDHLIDLTREVLPGARVLTLSPA